MKKMKVMVVGDDSRVQSLFGRHNFIVVSSKNRDVVPDAICFTGGEDVQPHLYSEERLMRTFTNPQRDTREIQIFERFYEKPKFGICRGAQLLNVLSGGSMWQHVNNHTSEHTLIDLLDQEEISVTSTHHQMMEAGKDGEILAIANRATQFMSSNESKKPPLRDTEVVWYESTNALCFQPHPEYGRAGNDTEKYFMRLLNYFY